MYESLKKRFTDQFGTKPGFVFSAPGRTEIGGNHTDHQHGCVLAGAVNLDTVEKQSCNNSGNRLPYQDKPVYHTVLLE